MAYREDNIDNNQNAPSGGITRTGLNRSTFLRPRKGRRSNSTHTTQVPSTPSRAPSVDTSDDTSTKSTERSTPREDTTQVVSDAVSNPIKNNFTDESSNASIPPPDSDSPYLRFIRNPYPSVLGENPVGNYVRSNGKIKLTGKFPENFLEFNEYPLAGITTTDGSYDFIIQFMDGTLYTSNIYMQELDLEFSVGNPYRNLQTVSTVKVDDALLSSYNALKKFTSGEQYAEMEMTNNINTKEEIIQHIDSLVGSGAELRSIDSMGSFTHKQTEGLGFEFQPLIDDVNDPNAKGEESNVSAEIGETTDPIITEGDVDTGPPPTINEVFPPFGVPGIRPSELRKKDGKSYRWDAARPARFGRRGRDTGTWICIGETAPTQSTPTPPPPPFISNGYSGLGNIGNLPGGGIGRKIICGELYRQGFLSEEVWAADQEFGKLLYKTHPRISLGYVFWAREVVKYMKNNPTHTKHLYKIFKPWTEHMAYKMGISDKPNIVGNITQKIGYVYSLVVYNYYQIKWKRFRFTL